MQHSLPGQVREESEGECEFPSSMAFVIIHTHMRLEITQNLELVEERGLLVTGSAAAGTVEGRVKAWL